MLRPISPTPVHSIDRQEIGCSFPTWCNCNGAMMVLKCDLKVNGCNNMLINSICQHSH